MVVRQQPCGGQTAAMWWSDSSGVVVRADDDMWWKDSDGEFGVDVCKLFI